MGEALITRRGGSKGLDLHVVGGTTRPANPKNNTIWLNTDTNITKIINYGDIFTRQDYTYTTTDPGVGSALPAGNLIFVYEA